MSAEPCVPISLAAGQIGPAGGGDIAGVTIRETAGAAATVRLFDNTAGSGVLLGTFGLAALQSIDVDYSQNRRYKTGVFAVITGTVEGSIFF